MQQLTLVEILQSIQYLQSYHEDGLQAETAPAFKSQGIDVVSELLKDEVGPSLVFEGFFDFWKPVKIGLLHLLIALNLVLGEPTFLHDVRLEHDETAVLFGTPLQPFILIFLDNLHRFVFPFDHTINLLSFRSIQYILVHR